MSTTDSLATDVWFRLASLVFDHRDAWRGEVASLTGLPFSRYRALRRCEEPTTASALAQGLDIDAAQASIVVGDLVAHGLLARATDPQDARRKIITITDAGRDMLRRVRQETSAASLFDVLTTEELHTLGALLDKLAAAAR